MKKMIEIIKKKWLTSILLTILLFAIIICAFLAINWAVEKANISDIDFTTDKIYSISQETKDKLQNLDQDITITLFSMGEYYKDFANKYVAFNKHIKVEELQNLTARADLKASYGITEENPFILIENEDKQKILYESDLYTYNYTTYKEVDITEEAITNAILDIITDVKPKIYFSTSNNVYSQEYFTYLKTELISEVNDVEFIDLLSKGNIPNDCDLLVLTALKKDITVKEKDAILKYINKGGEILLLLDPNINKIKIPNFQKILDQYGINNSDGIILEGDSNKMLSGAPYFIISTIYNDSSISKNINMELNACLMDAGKLSFASKQELEKKNVTIETLATASEKAFYRTDLTSSATKKISSDEDAAEAVVAATLTKKMDEEKTSKIIVFANTAFATNVLIPIDSQYSVYALDLYNNKDILLNAVSYLTQREDNITIRKTGETVTTYDVSEAQIRIILITIFVIPVVIIIIGIIIWQMRRRKK